MKLKDFKEINLEDSNPSGNDDIAMSTSFQHTYQNNFLRLEKLFNRFIILSIIISIMLVTIISFAYFHIKKQVLDLNKTQLDHIENGIKEIDEKVKFIDMQLADQQSSLRELPELIKRVQGLENIVAEFQKTKIDAKIFEDAAVKNNRAITNMISSIKQTNLSVDKFDKRIAENSKNNADTFQSIEEIKQNFFSAIKVNSQALQEHTDIIQQKISQLEKQVNTFSLNVDTNVDTLNQKTAELGKEISLINKRIETLQKEMISKSEANRHFNEIDRSLKQYSSLISLLDNKDNDLPSKTIDGKVSETILTQ